MSIWDTIPTDETTPQKKKSTVWDTIDVKPVEEAKANIDNQFSFRDNPKPTTFDETLKNPMDSFKDPVDSFF